MRYALFFLFVLSFEACQTNEEIGIIGIWQDIEYTDNMVIMHRKSSLDQNSPGYIFLENRKAKVNSSGWCGMAPVSYNLYNIKYALKKDNLMVENSLMLGQMLHYKIIELTPNRLILERME